MVRRHDVAAPDDVLLAAVLRDRAVRPLLQPIVELESGATAGYEALARGPVDHPLHLPDRLFAAARAAARLEELDALCRERALWAGQQAGLAAPTVLFVNVEPAALEPAALEPAALEPAAPEVGPGAPAEPLAMLTVLQERGVHVIVEFTERALTDDPAGLLAFAGRLRALGCGIALDDVGADPSSLALMPVLRPDVVKLDLRLVQDQPDALTAQTMTAVTAFAERYGAAIVAEGIESEQHERTALSLGATHGQGWLYGAPAVPEERSARPALPTQRRPIVPRSDALEGGHGGGFALVTRSRVPRQGTKRLLSEVSRLIERQAATMDGLAVVVATFQTDHHFGRTVRDRFAALAREVAFVAAIGADLDGEPAPGVRGADLVATDPLRHEWDLVVVGPHFSVALVARDTSSDEVLPESDRRFDYVLTYDRHLVLDVARLLLGRIRP